VPSPAWRSLADHGAYADAYAALGSDGVAHASQDATLDELLALADVARISGHPKDAVAPLSRASAAHGARAALAAFTLGRVELDSLQDAPPAAHAFARAIALGLPDGLIEDAYVRLVESRARSGDAAGAKAAANEYRARFPSGTRSSAMDRWTGAE
jgi:transmembrane sensor